MMLLRLEAGHAQAARPEKTSFAWRSAVRRMETGEQRELLATISKELRGTEEKCSLLGRQVSALESQLDDAKPELEKLDARCREAREALQNYKCIGDEDEEPDKTSSSESNMDEELRAKKAKRAHSGSEE